MKDELQWWDSFRYGDEVAFKRIFESYNRVLYNYGHKFVQDENMLDEAVQELFVKLWYNRKTIGETASVKNYLFKSYRRILVRKMERASRFLSLDLFSKEELNFEIELPHEIAIIRQERLEEIQVQLRRALAKMSPRQREVIHLRYFEELSYEEIADVMALSVKDTYKLTYRAMDSLKQHLSSFDLLVLLALVSAIK